MKITEIQIEQLKQLDKLMQKRIEQMQAIYNFTWYEELIKDEFWKMLCSQYAEVKTSIYSQNHGLKHKLISEAEMAKLVTSFTQIKDFKTIVESRK